MPEANRPPRLAVLIDAQNMPARIAPDLFRAIAGLGEASVRRIYGDFSGTASKGWTGAVTKHALDPRHHFACAAGKNAADIALVIDAMDLLHEGRVDGFCLVSSDSDFTRLATRLRESGAEVFGFGDHRAPESFRQACLRFMLLDAAAPAPKLLPGPAGPAPTPEPRRQPLPEALLARAIATLKGADGWVSLGPLGSQLASLDPTFDSRRFGAKKLSDLVRMIETLEVAQRAGGRLDVRLRAHPSGGALST